MSSGLLQTLEPISSRGGLSGAVVGRVVSAVLGGRFVEGDRLVVQKLAAQLQVSATPIREALVSLADIGLVRLLPNRGAVCLAFGPQQLREVYQIRRVLEAEAVRCACDALDEAALRALHHEMATLLEQPTDSRTWSADAMALDHRLHQLIKQHCGSARLQHELARYDTLMQGIRQHAANRMDVQRRALGEHLSIIAALLERNPARAAQRMAEHIRNTGRDVERLMFPSSAQDASD